MKTSIQEYTFAGHDVDGKYCEVMIHVNENGKVSSIYFYADGIPVLTQNIRTGESGKPVSTKPGLNPLFVHAVSIPSTLKKLSDNGFVMCGEEDWTDDIANVDKMYKTNFCG